MSSDPNAPFIPPPPPSIGNPMYSPEELNAKAKLVDSLTREALIMSLVGLVCFGFILGILAFRKANEALSTISFYQVGIEKQGLAKVAKVISVCDIVLWVLAIVLRVALM